jgi:hypothetical protein
MKTNRARRLAGMAVAACFLLAPAVAGAETLALRTLTYCESCDLHRFALNFEGDGSEPSGVTFNVQALVLLENTETGAWEGSCIAELIEGGAVLARDFSADIEVRFAPSGGGPGCPQTRIDALEVRGEGAVPGQFFTFEGAGVTISDPACPRNSIRGTLVLERGKGNVRRTLGSLKAGAR